MTPRQANDLLNSIEEVLLKKYGIEVTTIGFNLTENTTLKKYEQAEPIMKDYWKILQEW